MIVAMAAAIPVMFTHARVVLRLRFATIAVVFSQEVPLCGNVIVIMLPEVFGCEMSFAKGADA